MQLKEERDHRCWWWLNDTGCVEICEHKVLEIDPWSSQNPAAPLRNLALYFELYKVLNIYRFSVTVKLLTLHAQLS